MSENVKTRSMQAKICIADKAALVENAAFETPTTAV
jgi:hypothetical protein